MRARCRAFADGECVGLRVYCKTLQEPVHDSLCVAGWLVLIFVTSLAILSRIITYYARHHEDVLP